MVLNRKIQALLQFDTLLTHRQDAFAGITNCLLSFWDEPGVWEDLPPSYKKNVNHGDIFVVFTVL